MTVYYCDYGEKRSVLSIASDYYLILGMKLGKMVEMKRVKSK
jgi:hypothetical protein